MTTIKDLKSMAAGTEVKGMALMIKTARKTFRDTDGLAYQEVVFMDASGEMTGHILLGRADKSEQGHKAISEFSLWKSKTNICVMDGEIQDTDERKKESVKLLVFECFDAATPLTYDQNQELQQEDWKQIRQDEIKGKIRHGLVCAMVQTGDYTSLGPTEKKDIGDMVDFIMTGN